MANAVLKIKLFIFFPFFVIAVSANWGDIDKPGPAINEAAPLNWYVQICNIVQEIVDEFF